MKVSRAVSKALVAAIGPVAEFTYRITGKNRKECKRRRRRHSRGCRWDEIRLNSFAGRSLHCGLNASPTASQASVPRVASENKSCSNDGTVGE